MTGLEQKGGHQDVGVQHDAHQTMLCLIFARLSARTSRTVLSIRACNSSGSVSALRAFMSLTVQRKMWARTASSMNFDSFLIREPRKSRRARAVLFDTLKFQRTVSCSILKTIYLSDCG